MYLVRYADDFKIFCRSYKDAVKAFEATKRWLKDRLGLDISPEKSKVINMEQRYSEYLGFKMKVYRKGKKYVVCSHMSDKAIAHAKEKIFNPIFLYYTRRTPPLARFFDRLRQTAHLGGLSTLLVCFKLYGDTIL